MSNTRVAEIVAVYPPYGGGLGVVAYENARMLSEKFSVTVYTPRKKGAVDGSSRVSVRYLKPFLLYGNAASLPQLAWLLRNEDVIHFHYPCIGASLPTLFAKILWRKKLVITYHMDLVGKRQPFKFIFWFFNTLITPLMFSFADKVFVTSFDYAQAGKISRLFKKGGKRFYELPVSVDTSRFRPGEKAGELLEKYGLSLKDKIILFVGGLDKAHYFKGVEYLIDAFVLVRDKVPFSKLIIVGEGELKEGYRARAKQRGIDAHLFFVGSLAQENGDPLPEHYRLADIFVLPSVDSSEAFGTVLIEAGASGKPVIASDLPGVRSVVKNNETGLLAQPKNAEDLAEKIIFLLDNPEIAKKMGQQGQLRVNELYSNEAVSKKIGLYFNE